MKWRKSAAKTLCFHYLWSKLLMEKLEQIKIKVILEPLALSSFCSCKTMETHLQHYLWTKFALCSHYVPTLCSLLLHFLDRTIIENTIMLKSLLRLLRIVKVLKRRPPWAQPLNFVRLSQLLQVGRQDHGGDHTIAQRRKGIVRGHQDLKGRLQLQLQEKSKNPSSTEISDPEELKIGEISRWHWFLIVWVSRKFTLKLQV